MLRSVGLRPIYSTYAHLSLHLRRCGRLAEPMAVRPRVQLGFATFKYTFCHRIPSPCFTPLSSVSAIPMFTICHSYMLQNIIADLGKRGGRQNTASDDGTAPARVGREPRDYEWPCVTGRVLCLIQVNQFTSAATPTKNTQQNVFERQGSRRRGSGDR